MTITIFDNDDDDDDDDYKNKENCNKTQQLLP